MSVDTENEQNIIERKYSGVESAEISDSSADPVEPVADDSADHYVEHPSQAQELRQPARLILREILETLLLTLIIFWMVNTLTGRFRIEGSSMMPTMHEGQYILINKLAYYLDEPERGDIIVLHYPRDPSRDFIKRVIALPGDVVEVTDRRVKVNGVLLDEPYINGPPTYSGNWTVPPGEYFVLGDNRNNSSDSHTWGMLPRDLIVGRGWAVYWPYDEIQTVPHNPHPEVNAMPPLLASP